MAYFSGQDESWGGPAFDVGFERADVRYDARVEPHRRYSTFSTAGSLAVPMAVVQERVREYLAGRRPGRPLLLYVNLHDTHFPYHHAGVEPLVASSALPRALISPRNRVALRETYLNTVANVDRAIGAILDCATAALKGPPAVIVTADHGESLYDEGFLGHGYALNDIQTRIPLIVSGLPLHVAEPFGQSDLRDRLAEALRGHTVSSGPTVTALEGRRVFQYLGGIDRPRQIAFVSTQGRTAYDFATRRARVHDGPWQHVDRLSAAAAEEYLSLVHYWERMMLARSTAP